MSALGRARPIWRLAAVALLVQSLAILGFWSDRLYFGDRAHLALQSILLIIGVIALLIAIALGTAALSKVGQARRNVSFVLAGVAVAAVAFTIIYFIGSKR